MRLFDGKKLVEIKMTVGDRATHSPDWSRDFFDGVTKYNDDLDAWVVDDVEYCVGQAHDWEDKEGDYQYDEDPYGIERFVDVTDIEYIEMEFFWGDGKHFAGGVNYIVSDDGAIYAECSVPDVASEEYGYKTMKDALIDAMTERGMDTENINWFYDDDNLLSDDAEADTEVYIYID